LRSAVPSYLLAIVATLAIAGPVIWRVARQTEAIQEVEARPPPMTPEATSKRVASPLPTAIPPPPDPNQVAVSRLTTTSAQVKTTSAAVAAPSATIGANPTAEAPPRQKAKRTRATVVRDDSTAGEENPYDTMLRTRAPRTALNGDESSVFDVRD
jgi:hypothetical protein